MDDQAVPATDNAQTKASLWDLLKGLSGEAQQAAKKKAVEQGYSLDSGSIPFEETLINLSLARDTLLSAIESTAINQLPLKIQRQLYSDVTKISSHLNAMIGGNDSTASLETSVDDLTSTIWYSNIKNLSGEVLGLHQKLNQLKSLEKSLRELSNKAEDFSAKAVLLDQQTSSAEQATEKTQRLSILAEEKLQEINRKADDAKLGEQKVSACLAIADQSEKSLATSASNARSASAEIETFREKGQKASLEIEALRNSVNDLKTNLESFKQTFEAVILTEHEAQGKYFKEIELSIKNLYDSTAQNIESNRTMLDSSITNLSRMTSESLTIQINNTIAEMKAGESIRNQNATTQLNTSKAAFEAENSKIVKATKLALDTLEEEAKSFTTKNQRETSERLEDLKKLEDVIRDKILQATNYQLFHAFQKRKEAIEKGVGFWRSALFYCVGASFVTSLIIAFYLVRGNPTYNAAFFLKLGFTIPIIYAIHFCSSQYSKERQLEEEYAFKGNISISLEPYRELVEKLVNKSEPAEATKYLDFVLSSIEKVFTSPTERILNAPTSKLSADEVGETSKGVSKILGSVNELLQSLAKFK